MINKNAELERAYERGYADGMAAESIARTKKYPIAFTHEEYNAVIEAAIADGVKTERERIAKQFDSGLVNVRARGQHD